MYDRFFREYLFLHKEILKLAIHNDKYGGKITNNDVILIIYMVKHQLNHNKGITKPKLNEFRAMQNSTIYRTLKRLIDKELVIEENGVYKFVPEIPPHLKRE